MNDIGVIILAAGLGKRMNSRLPKVLHPLVGKPLLFYALRAVRELRPKRITVVVGRGADDVQRAFHDGSITWVLQEEQLGTGHAVRCARESFRDFTGDLVIVSADVPLISPQSLSDLLRRHRDRTAVVTLLTASLEQPAGYGRVLRNAAGDITGVLEERDAAEPEKHIKEINAGIYAASPRFLFAALEEIGNRNQQGEYYLPDILGVALRRGERIETVRAAGAREILGVNTREELAIMEKTLQEKINRQWMAAGVTLKDPETAYIEEGVTIGKDTVIGPNTHLLGRTTVGEGCRIDGSAYVTDAHLGNDVHLRFSVVLADCQVAAGAIVGPFAHLRPGTVLHPNARIGTFVEVKNSSIGERTQANHLSYIGDAEIGKDANVGAGTITCNFDGFRKYETRIGDRVQVGSDTTLVAPVTLGDDVYVATATTVRHDVPAGALVYNERIEKGREGWTAEKRKRMAQSKN